MTRWRGVLFGLLAAFVVGCGRGDGIPRCVLTGTVTYRGQPVADGTILFIPSEGTTGPSVAVSLEEGKYRADTWGGLPPGTYRVEILGYRAPVPGEKKAAPRRQSGPTAMSQATNREQYLPDKYNKKTQLKTAVEAGSKTATKDFALAE